MVAMKYFTVNAIFEQSLKIIIYMQDAVLLWILYLCSKVDCTRLVSYFVFFCLEACQSVWRI